MPTQSNHGDRQFKGRCFVIMPFSTTTEQHDKRYWTNMFKNYISPSVTALGYECVRSEAKPQSIVEGIVNDLFNSAVVLAILTDNNPNVWYELGIRHSLSRGTIMAIERPNRVPFDVAHFGYIQYDRQRRDLFQSDLDKFFATIEGSVTPDSPVKEYLSSRSPIGLACVANDVAVTPFHFDHILANSKQDIFIIGQNLYSLANNITIRDKLFGWLETKPQATVGIMVIDRSNPQIVAALSRIIDETMEHDLEQATRTFRSWKTEWNKIAHNDQRLDIKMSEIIGNVSFTFIDGGSLNGMALVRPILYHTPPNDRPCFWIKRSEHGQTFRSYWNKYHQYWAHAIPLQ
jgi:hypothetical protein